MSEGKDGRRERLEADRVRRGAAHDSTAGLQQAFTEAASAAAQALQPFVLATIRMLQVIAQDPVVRFAMEHPELLRTERAQPCHCLCGKAHPGERGICVSEAVTSRHYRTGLLGDVDVPLCGPCAVAQGLTEVAGP